MTIAALKDILFHYLVNTQHLPVASTDHLDLYTEHPPTSPKGSSKHPRTPMFPNMVLSEAHIYPASLANGSRVCCKVLLPRKHVKTSLNGMESEDMEEEGDIDDEDETEEVIPLESIIHEEAQIALWRYFNSVLPAVYQFEDSHLRNDRRHHASRSIHHTELKSKYSSWKLFFDECCRHHRYYKCIQSILVGPPRHVSDEDVLDEDLQTVDGGKRVPYTSLEDKEWSWSNFYLSTLEIFTIVNVTFALAILLCSLLPPEYIKTATGSTCELVKSALCLYLLTHMVYIFILQPSIDVLFYTLSAKVLDTKMLTLAQGFVTSNTKKATFAYCRYPSSIYHARYRLLRSMKLCEEDTHQNNSDVGHTRGWTGGNSSLYSQSLLSHFSNSVMSYKTNNGGKSHNSRSGNNQSALFRNVLKISLQYHIARQDRLNRLVLSAINPDFDETDIMQMLGGGNSGRGSAHRSVGENNRSANNSLRNPKSIVLPSSLRQLAPPPLVITQDPSALPAPIHKLPSPASYRSSSTGTKTRGVIRSPNVTQMHHPMIMPSHKSAISSILYHSNKVAPQNNGQPRPSSASDTNWCMVCCGCKGKVGVISEDLPNSPQSIRHLQLRQVIHHTHQSHPNSIQSQLQCRVASHHSPRSSNSHPLNHSRSSHMPSSINASRSQSKASSVKSKSFFLPTNDSHDGSKHIDCSASIASTDLLDAAAAARKDRSIRASAADTVVLDRDGGTTEANRPTSRNAVFSSLTNGAHQIIERNSSSLTTVSAEDEVVQLDLLEKGFIPTNDSAAAKNVLNQSAIPECNSEEYDQQYSLGHLEAAFGDIEQLCIAFTQKTLEFDRPFFNLSYMVVMQGQSLLQRRSDCQRVVNFQKLQKSTLSKMSEEEESLTILTQLWQQYRTAWNLNEENALFLPIQKYNRNTGKEMKASKAGAEASPVTKRRKDLFKVWSKVLNTVHYALSYSWFMLTYYIPHAIAYKVCDIRHRRLNAFRYQPLATANNNASNKQLNMEDLLSALLLPPDNGNATGQSLELPQDCEDLIFVLCQSSVSLSTFLIAVLYQLCPLATWIFLRIRTCMIWMLHQLQAWCLYVLLCGSMPYNAGAAKRSVYDPFLVPNMSLMALMEKQRQSLFFASDANVGIEVLQQYMQDSLGGLFTLPGAVLHLKTKSEYSSLPLVPRWRYASALLFVIVLNIAAALLTLTYMILPLVFSNHGIDAGHNGTGEALSSYASFSRLLEVVLAVFLAVLMIESVFVETLSVYYQHILVPCAVRQDVQDCLRRIVPEIFQNFTKFLLQASESTKKAIEVTAANPTATSAFLQKYNLTKEDTIKSDAIFFSMSDYLYVSIHLAKSFPVLLESLLVLAPCQLLPSTGLQCLWKSSNHSSDQDEANTNRRNMFSFMRERWLYSFVTMPIKLHMVVIRVSLLLLAASSTYGIICLALYLSEE